MTNLDVMSEGSLVRMPEPDELRTLDSELAAQPVTVLRRVVSPTDPKAD
ncbi:MAG: hypothetical protein VYA62_01550 [Planctomycetota bacterium]|nr:hypothetical protein [Planctomycetota bacterium]